MQIESKDSELQQLKGWVIGFNIKKRHKYVNHKIIYLNHYFKFSLILKVYLHTLTIT